MRLKFDDGHFSNFDDVINYIDNGQEDLRPLFQDICTHFDNNDFNSSDDYDKARYSLKKIRSKVSSNLDNQSYVNDSKGVAVASIILMINAVITAIMFILILISRL